MKEYKKSFLELLYDEELFSVLGLDKRNPAYLPTCREADKEQRYLAERLSDKDKEHLENFAGLRNDMAYMESFARFSFGFRYGMLLMHEMLADVEKDAESRCN